MEDHNEDPKKDQLKEPEVPSNAEEQEEVEFENPSVDPGFDTSYESPDENESPENTKPSEENAKGNDALNYNNDRENGAYNPKNI
ncbi:MAG: hypothetical protein ABWY16_17580 [Pedobacter sp.]|jgi:hypothetical protein|uniref:hypothetical protein n=1 Tax=Pedobacter sp. TaxID=1411316 RepID=UPI003394527D